MNVASIVGGWAGLAHAPQEVEEIVSTFPGDSSADPIGLLRYLRRASQSPDTTMAQVRWSSWHGFGRILLFLLAGNTNAANLSGAPSTDEVRAIAPDRPVELCRLAAGLLQENPRDRNPFIRFAQEQFIKQEQELPFQLSAKGATTTTLTTRESEVLGLIVEGLTNQQIGTTLSISRHTADRHVQNIYRKLGVSRPVDATVVAVRDGLLD